MNEFMTVETMATFAGLTAAVALIVQFTKSIVKKQFGDASVRLYAFAIALLLTFIFAPASADLPGIVLTILNAILVTMSAVGGYEMIADPYAEKKRIKQ